MVTAIDSINRRKNFFLSVWSTAQLDLRDRVPTRGYEAGRLDDSRKTDVGPKGLSALGLAWCGSVSNHPSTSPGTAREGASERRIAFEGARKDV